MQCQTKMKVWKNYHKKKDMFRFVLTKRSPSGGEGKGKKSKEIRSQIILVRYLSPTTAA